jgi:hypothetical protein
MMEIDSSKTNGMFISVWPTGVPSLSLKIYTKLQTNEENIKMFSSFFTIDISYKKSPLLAAKHFAAATRSA